MRTPKPILERRRSIRIEEKLSFKIGHAGYDIQAATVNISSHGAMCLIDKSIPMMTQLKISLSIPPCGASKRSRKIQVKGAVVRKDRDALSGKFLIGIYFSEISEKAQEVLNEFIVSRLKKDSPK